MWLRVLFLVWFNNFDGTTGFYWSCMLYALTLAIHSYVLLVNVMTSQISQWGSRYNWHDITYWYQLLYCAHTNFLSLVLTWSVVHLYPPAGLEEAPGFLCWGREGGREGGRMREEGREGERRREGGRERYHVMSGRRKLDTRSFLVMEGQMFECQCQCSSLLVSVPSLKLLMALSLCLSFTVEVIKYWRWWMGG